MTYTTKQIELAVSAAEGPRTLANSIWRDAFERDAPAIVRQQQARIKDLEAALQDAKSALSNAMGELSPHARTERPTHYPFDPRKSSSGGEA